MSNLINASRSYEANLAALQTARQLALKAMEIGAK
jgi:flagellar basal-body rod protein FlgC